MTILPSNKTINPYLIQHPYFNLAVRKSSQETAITMSLLTNYFHTDSIPSTYKILQQNLPAVLKTECFNDSHLPFDAEVKNTEIGHLFEHILLEYLCQHKIQNGHKKASFRGLTQWNWKKDLKGTFHITIEAKPEDTLFFKEALEKSVLLLNTILSSRKRFSLGFN